MSHLGSLIQGIKKKVGTAEPRDRGNLSIIWILSFEALINNIGKKWKDRAEHACYQTLTIGSKQYGACA